MALVKVKPTSPGRRVARQGRQRRACTRARRSTSLVESQKRGSGRNNNGHITMRHKGGGHKQHYRIVDFKRNKDGIAGEGRAARIRPEPQRATSRCCCYADGERRYIIAPRGVAVGAQLMSGAEAPIKPGNTLPLRNIPVGTTIHCVEMHAGQGRADRALGRRRACSCSRAKASTRSCGCARARSARCTSTAARRSAKSATRSTACARSARPVRSAGAASARRCAASR